MQLPTLKHIPPQAIVRIPGPPVIGSRRARVSWGEPIVQPLGIGGCPSGDMIINYWTNSGGNPAWFAVSDGGAGFIPWGFWQVAMYPVGDLPPGPETLSFGKLEVDASILSVGVATALSSKLRQLRSQGISAGFTNAAKMIIPSNVDALVVTDPTDVRGGMYVDGPFGLTNLQGFYSGPFWLGQGEVQLPMLSVAPGFDNPLFMALWSPGNRALLRVEEAPPPSRYPGYPYPSNPPNTRIG